MKNEIRERGLKATNIVDGYFYKLPAWLFTNDKYNKMSNNAKVAYALIKNCCGYSIRQNWVDEEGKVYFIFTVKELEEMLNLSRSTVAKVKAELIEFGLLEIVHERWYLLEGNI